MPATGPLASGERTATEDGLVEVVLVRREPSAPGGETTAVRLLGLLPAHWICAPEVGTDRVRLRIEYGGAGDVHGAVAAVLADSALRGWVAEDA